MADTVEGLLKKAIEFEDELNRLHASRRLPEAGWVTLRPTDPLWQKIEKARFNMNWNLKRAAELEQFIAERTTPKGV